MINRKIFYKPVVLRLLIARGDQKVLRFHALSKKVVKINYRSSDDNQVLVSYKLLKNDDSLLPSSISVL